MKKIFYSLSLLFCISCATAQVYLDQNDCEALKELYALEKNTNDLSSWTYNSGTSISSCNCDPSTNDLPTITDVGTVWNNGFYGVKAEDFSGTGYVTEMYLEELLSNWSTGTYGLFKSGSHFSKLDKLRLGNTGQSAPAVIEENALPLLTEFIWQSEASMKSVVDLSEQTGSPNWWPLPSLEEINFIIFSDLDDYSASNVDLLKDRPDLERILLYQLVFDDGVPAFDNFYKESRNTLKYVYIENVYGPFNGSQWYPTDFVSNDWDNLETLRLTRNPFSSTLEPSGQIFTDANFPELVYLSLDYNGFTGGIPEGAFDMPHLTHLQINNNSLTGEVLPNLTANSTAPIEIYIAGGGNTFKENRLGKFQYVPTLKQLWLNSAELECDINDLDLTQCSGLEKLYINNNYFTGDMSSSFFHASAFPSAPVTTDKKCAFNCATNMLTGLTSCGVNLDILLIHDNFLNLDDVWEVVQPSEASLRTADNSLEDNFIISPQYSKWGDQAMSLDISSISIEPEESHINLSSDDAGNNPGTGLTYVRKWKRSATSSVDPDTDSDAGGTNSGADYAWSDNATFASNSGSTWYCKMFIDDPVTSTSTDGKFYEELICIGGRTIVSYNTNDVCDFTNPSPGLQPFDEEGEEGNSNNGNTANAKDFQNPTISKANVKSTVSVYPNPSHGLVTIESDEIIEQLEVRDLSGKRIDVQNANARRVNYSTSHLQEGTYLVRLKTQSGWSTTKITKSE